VILIQRKNIRKQEGVCSVGVFFLKTGLSKLNCYIV